ncbi:hypothetical protein [Allorhizocola rhizosphaerae]|uniref:hypothetical protein n=1 Tax=Allorhizocola rhizosphaerae TaxID=1872709 RepID=UPI000E3EBEE8|nr:hypothetical protein [Allorhizocola rhizosphaerae]
MNVTWEAIPSADTEPASAEPSRIRALADAAVNRRTVIRSVAALGMTLGVTALGWVTPGGRRAEAAVGSEHGNCAGYAYDNILCVGAPYSQNYCGGDGWFLNGVINGWRWYPITACAGRNAWIWDVGRVGYRCADGHRAALSGGSYTFLICSYPAYRR